jgi:hydrogenase maturation factor HypF (carbamoyltransferase family)
LAELLEIPEKEYQEWRNSESFSDTTETHAALTLFDAVAAAIGIGVPVKHYGQQILLRMEHAVSCGYDDAEAVKLMEKFPFQVRNDDLMMIDWLPFFRQISNLKTLRSHSPGDLTAAFFHSAAEAALQMVLYGSGFTPCRDVVLSGKAFLSPTLTGFVMERLENAGFQVYCHEVSSPDESSASIGQAIAGGMI